MLNVSAFTAERSLWEKVMFYSITTVPCCVLLFVNCTMLVALRSKAVFRETCRYVLLYNLLFADTLQLAVSQLLYLLAALRFFITYPVCGVLTTLSNMALKVSPVTLVFMSFDQYVAVCYPLRHATIVTMGKTRGAIGVIWVVCSLNLFSCISLLWDNPFEGLASLQMEHYCTTEHMPLSPSSLLFDNVYRLTVLVGAGVCVCFSYGCVLFAARSASTNKESARKAHKTLLLHLFQLCLNLSSTIVKPVNDALAKVIDGAKLLRLYIVLYICMIIFPACFSSLIYSIRDQAIRPVLLQHLLCHLTTDTSGRRAP